MSGEENIPPFYSALLQNSSQTWTSSQFIRQTSLLIRAYNKTFQSFIYSSKKDYTTKKLLSNERILYRTERSDEQDSKDQENEMS